MCRLLLLWLGVVHLAWGQYPPYFAYDDETGLPSNEMYGIVQGLHGQIWIACDAGLFLYNGVSYKAYHAPTQRSTPKAGPVVASSGRIYCFNFQSQLFYVDPADDALHELGYPYDGIYSIAASKDGKLYVNNREGVGVYDETTKRWHLINNYCQQNNKAIDGACVSRSLEIAAGGDIYWFALPGLVVRPADRPAALEIIRPRNIDSYNPGFFLNRWAHGRLWVFQIYGEGIYTFTPGDSDLKRYEEDTLMKCLRGRKLTNVRLLADGCLWICTYSGVIRYCLQDKQATIFYPDIAFSDCLLDREGNYWFTSLQHGVLRVPSLTSAIWTQEATGMGSDKVMHVASAPGKVFFTAINGKIGVLDKKSGRPELVDTGWNADIQCFRYDAAAGEVYFYLNGNFLVLDRHYRLRVMAQRMPPLKDCLRLGNEFILASSAGIFVYNRLSQQMRVLQKGWARAIQATATGVWVATDNGLYCVQRKQSRWVMVEHVLQKQQVLSLAVHDSSAVYALTHEGEVIRCDRGTYVTITKLPYHVRPYRLQVNDARVFVATNRGLWVFDKRRKEWMQMSKLEGLASNTIRAIAIDNSNVWVGTGRGLQRLPVEVKPPENRTDLHVHKLLVNGQPVGKSVDIQAIDYESEIEVYPEVMAYRSGGTHRYAYRLGKDKDWIYLPGGTEKIEIRNMPPGDFELSLRLLDHQGRKLQEQTILRGSVLLPFWQSSLGISLMLGSVVLLSILIAQRVVRGVRRQAFLQTELSNLRLVAIRAQMNPHFIFNALNSIQALVLKARLEEAYSYITIFSSLVRYTLHLSDKEFIEFEQEYKLLELYLKLEKLRFGDALTYNIEAADGVEDVLLPSMIIQPFVENALIHGLLHKKEGSKHLHVAFLLKENYLLCTVSDNGIGREAAKRLQQKRGKNYRSFSGEAIRRRFEVLRQQYKLQNMGYVYEDLTDSYGDACGTRVHICLPVQYAY